MNKKIISENKSTKAKFVIMHAYEYICAVCVCVACDIGRFLLVRQNRLLKAASYSL